MRTARLLTVSRSARWKGSVWLGEVSARHLPGPEADTPPPHQTGGRHLARDQNADTGVKTLPSCNFVCGR